MFLQKSKQKREKYSKKQYFFAFYARFNRKSLNFAADLVPSNNTYNNF